MPVTEAGMVMEVKPVHPSKALLPIAVMPSETMIDLKPVHPEKMLAPMVASVPGMVRVVNPVQSLNA
jgi:hypothetical protein